MSYTDIKVPLREMVVLYRVIEEEDLRSRVKGSKFRTSCSGLGLGAKGLTIIPVIMENQMQNHILCETDMMVIRESPFVGVTSRQHFNNHPSETDTILRASYEL